STETSSSRFAAGRGGRFGGVRRRVDERLERAAGLRSAVGALRSRDGAGAAGLGSAFCSPGVRARPRPPRLPRRRRGLVVSVPASAAGGSARTWACLGGAASPDAFSSGCFFRRNRSKDK